MPSAIPKTHLVAWRTAAGQTGQTRMRHAEALAHARRFRARRCWALVVDMSTYQRVAEFGTPFAQLPPAVLPGRRVRP